MTGRNTPENWAAYEAVRRLTDDVIYEAATLVAECGYEDEAAIERALGALDADDRVARDVRATVAMLGGTVAQAHENRYRLYRLAAKLGAES